LSISRSPTATCCRAIRRCLSIIGRLRVRLAGIAFQQAVAVALEEHGHPTQVARKLLAQFEDVQAMHVADRLLDELARCTD
jgi:hypothetical protein